LGDKLKQLAYNAMRDCYSCKQLNLKHDICYYHRNGYVEIKLKEDENLRNEIIGKSSNY
jgi:hypothetical protein